MAKRKRSAALNPPTRPHARPWRGSEGFGPRAMAAQVRGAVKNRTKQGLWVAGNGRAGEGRCEEPNKARALGRWRWLRS
eukprot:353229-Chlamydomonas_euryale.AAC.1